MERITEAETAIMKVLWQDSPLTAQEVMERVPDEKGWQANTVKTLLARLVAKKAVEHTADGRRYLYRPLIAQDDYVTGESQLLIDRLFGGRLMPLGAPLGKRDDVSAEEIAENQALLKEFKP